MFELIQPIFGACLVQRWQHFLGIQRPLERRVGKSDNIHVWKLFFQDPERIYLQIFPVQISSEIVILRNVYLFEHKRGESRACSACDKNFIDKNRFYTFCYISVPGQVMKPFNTSLFVLLRCLVKESWYFKTESKIR